MEPNALVRWLAHEPEQAGDIEVDDDEVVVAVTRTELVTLVNAVRESVGAIDAWEFDTRVGGTHDEGASACGSKIIEVIRQTELPQT